MTEKVKIQFESGELEGIFKGLGNNRGVIITHPHPDYGGDMHNGVVMTIEKAYHDNGYSTLRFNFRGTGNSTGDYDTFHDLCDDVAAAYRFMIDRGISDITLAGYSFGAWINAHADEKVERLTHQLLVSPPVSFMDFSQVRGFSCNSFVICGDRDEYAALPAIKRHLESWNVTSFEIIKGCDHFYSGMVEQLYIAVEKILFCKRP
ncbi:MAG: alpha/beta hydrolase [Desulfamplus sp.]|nr:alpha/beta hydrolase [Desulfamplus sp.]